MATLNMQPGSGYRPNKRTRPNPNGRSLRLEALENRLALAGFVFIDYGDNFPLVGSTRTLNTTIEGLINIADSATPNDKILGTAIGDSAGFSPVFNGQVTFSAAARTITRASGNFVNEGFRANQQITISNTVSNNGNFIIQSLTSTVLTLTPAATLANETAAAARIGPRLDTPVRATRPGYTANERAQILAVVQRDFRPLEVTVVELSQTAQTLADGRIVAAAASIVDIVTTLRAGTAAFRDAYIIAASFTVSPGGPNQNVYSSGGGNSPGSPTLGVASDLATGTNTHDDVALVYALGIGGDFRNTMNNIAHEAGHLLGLQHSVTDTGTNATTLQLHQAEIMSYQNTNNTSSSMFTRYPMIRGDGNNPVFTDRVVFNAAARTLTATNFGYPVAFAPGTQILVSGTASNNGTFTIQSRAGSVITLNAGSVLTDETATNTTIRPPNMVNYNDLGARNTPAGQQTYHDQLANDANVRANQSLTFVSGTGANDIITIAKSGSTATVTVQAFTSANYAAGTAITVPGAPGVTTFQYTIPLTQSLLVYGGDGADRFVIDADLGVSIEVDGMLGVDTLFVNGKNNASLLYVPNSTAPNGVDLVTAIGGMMNVMSYGGTVTTGSTSIVFRDFDPMGSVNVRDIGTATLRTPNATDSLIINSIAAGTNRVVGSSGGVTVVPFVFQSVTSVVLDTGTNERATGNDTVTLGTVLRATGLQNFTINSGDGSDTDRININVTNISLPVAGGAFTYNGGAGGQDTLFFAMASPTDVTYTPDGFNDPSRGTLTYNSANLLFTGLEFVRPVTPVINSVSLASSAVNEGSVATLNGAFTDPGSLSSHKVTIDWGDGTVAIVTSLAVGSRTFSITHTYADDNPTGTPFDLNQIKITLSDNDTLSDADSTSITVFNVDPVISAFLAGAPSNDKAKEGMPITATGSFTDVGILDTHTVIIDWGDGSVAEAAVVVEASGAGTFSAAHTFISGGIFNVKILLVDDDTGQATTVDTVFITGAGIHLVNGKKVLQVVGTNDADSVIIDEPGYGVINVYAAFLTEFNHRRVFDRTGIDYVEVVLCDGDDNATLAGFVTLPAIVDGGKGNDRLTGGSGGIVLIGGAGDDWLAGSTQRSILIGGEGRDQLIGRFDDDILIGGRTLYDSGPDEFKLANDAGLIGLLAEWKKPTPAAVRKANIEAGIDGYFLQLGGTVFDDGVKDRLTGSIGTDWFWRFTEDELRDYHVVGDLISG